MLSFNVGLLEWLLNEAGGSYMSDLRNGIRRPEMTTRLCKALRKVPSGEWRPEQWGDAAGYLTDEHRFFSSQEEYVMWLLDYLEKA